MALASLVLSIVWIAGIGSVVAIALGFMSRRKTKRSAGTQEGAVVASAGIAIGIAGLIFAAVFWMIVAGNNGGSTITNSPSYVDGSHYAGLYYDNATAESTVCTPKNISSGDTPSLWMRGCHDAWATARFAINNGSGAGLNIGNYSS
ncbi:MAG TPA: DUF4190 domain-containing protein [Acidimicrobiales bacterium]|jgi:hypothetical protein|nr:DUF4190 domain-containing protein [Acidimicrobiales bacterium]